MSIYKENLLGVPHMIKINKEKKMENKNLFSSSHSSQPNSNIWHQHKRFTL